MQAHPRARCRTVWLRVGSLATVPQARPAATVRLAALANAVLSGSGYGINRSLLGVMMSDATTIPDWERLESDVIRKLRLLRPAWEHTAQTPEPHGAMVKDLYLPALKQLASFCGCVEEDADQPS